MNRQRTRWEIVLVLALSLGASAVYSVVQFLDAVTQPTSLGGQTTALNPTLDSRWVFDLVYRLLAIATPLVPVLLALFLLAPSFGAAATRIGLDFRRPRFDFGGGVLLAAVIGIPGLGLYLVAHAIGINTAIDAADLTAWYAVPVLLLRAAQAAVQEEVIVTGYLFERLRDLGVRPMVILIGAALLRGSYHLYQGVGGFVGNLVMGLVFGLVYLKWRRTAPLVVAHFLLDAVSFLGYPIAKALWPGLLP